MTLSTSTQAVAGSRLVACKRSARHSQRHALTVCMTKPTRQGGEVASNQIEDFEQRVDEAGRAISDATQEASGLTQSATTFEPAPAGTTDKLQEAMAFPGSAPERINGRLAMLALVATWGAEVVTGQPLMRQIAQAPFAIAGTFLLFIVATLIPIVRGESMDKKSGIFTPRAEAWNGRLAMVAFVLLLLVETFKGGPAFH